MCPAEKKLAVEREVIGFDGLATGSGIHRGKDRRGVEIEAVESDDAVGYDSRLSANLDNPVAIANCVTAATGP